MFYSFKRGQDFSLAASDGYRMLIMSCRFTITSAYSPTVGHQPNLAVAQGYHRLDGYAHAFFKHDAIATPSIIWYLWVFMHLFAYTVSGKLAHYAIAMRLAKSLNCISNITDMIASNCHFDTFIQRLSCHCQ